MEPPHIMTPNPYQPDPPAPNHRRRKYWIIGLVVALLLGGAGVGYWMYLQQKPPVATNTSNSVSKSEESAKPKQPLSPELQRFVSPQSGETWYARPKEIAALGYLKSETVEYFTQFEKDKSKIEAMMKAAAPAYYEAGKRADFTIVVVLDPSSGMMPTYHIFERAVDGTVTMLVKPQKDMKYEGDGLKYARDITTAKVSQFNDKVQYDSLSVPASIPLENGEQVVREEYASLGTNSLPYGDQVLKTKVADYGASKLYRVERSFSDTKLTNVGYYIELPYGGEFSLSYTPNTLSLEKYTWANNTPAMGKNYDGIEEYDTITPIARGCGGLMAAVTRSDVVKQDDLQYIGKTDTGREVYQPKDQAHMLLKKAYDEYVQFAAVDSKKTVSFTDFIQAHGLVIIKNSAGEYLVYARQHYAPKYGCAKPVVYLYPDSARSVDVAVGANVILSDPLYPSGGWKNVRAEPSGKLTYQGHSYSSLYWEGPGIGNYPTLTEGTVVAVHEVAATMRRQLEQQGLNAQEITDFMEFWQPRIPQKPYVRLSWLTTKQMDELAPLRIAPTPDSVKRVFLDMEGLDTPVRIKPQRLDGFTRRGFTVVEWGGLSTVNVE